MVVKGAEFVPVSLLLYPLVFNRKLQPAPISWEVKMKPKLLDQVRDKIRFLHYSIRTEQAYVDWIRRYVLFHDKKANKILTQRRKGAKEAIRNGYLEISTGADIGNGINFGVKKEVERMSEEPKNHMLLSGN